MLILILCNTKYLIFFCFLYFFFCGLWRKKLAHMDKVWNIFRIFQKPNQNC